MNTLKEFLQVVIRVILFPFRLVISIVDGLASITPKIKSLYNHSLNRIIDRINKRRIKKESEYHKNELKNICLGHNYSFNNKITHIFILCATTGLQFISFFTTFAGTRYYFGNITTPKYLGPFIITCVIQFSVLFLSNSVVNRESVGKGKKVMLAFFLFVSIMFSYAGMVHTIITPHKEMKVNYEEFITKYEEIFHVYLSEFNQDENVSSYVDSKVNELQFVLNNRINTTKTQLDNTNKYSSTSSSSNTTTNIDGETSSSHSSSSTINSEWTRLNNEYNTLLSLKKQLSNNYKSVQDSLSQAISLSDEKSILEALKSINNADEFITTYNYIVDQINELTHINNFETIYYQLRSNESLIQNQCLTYEQIENKVQQQMNIQANNSNIEYLSNIANEIEEQILNYEKSPLYLEEDLTHLGISNESLNECKQISLKAKTIKDFNSLAYGYLNPTNSNFSKAGITFIFACFIDLTTFLIPYFMERKNKNILYVKKKKDIQNKEEAIFNQLLNSMSPLTQDNVSNSKKMKEELEIFISIFELSNNSSIEEGYSFRCHSDKFNEYSQNNKKLSGFIVFLMNMNYLIIDEKHIFDENTYVYIRSKFILWIQEKIALLSQYIVDEEKTREGITC